MVWQQHTHQRTYTEQIPVTNNLIFFEPDEYTVNGDLLKFTGQRLKDKQEILVYYRLRSEQEKDYFSRLQQPITVQVSGKIGPISGPTNENEFDFRRYMQGKNIVNELQADQLTVNFSGQKKLNWQNISFVHSWRKKMIDHFEKMPEPLGWFIQVLVIGYQSEQFQEQMDQINRLGLLYLFTLSGMHVYYLVTLIRFIFRQFGFAKETTDFLLLGILPFYALLGGGSLGLVRSLAMSWLHIFSNRCGFQKLSVLETWSIVLLLNLWHTPAAIFSLGAQLSYLLTLILILARPKNQGLVGLQLGMFTLPLVLWQTFIWNIWTIPLSILIGPIFDWIIFPVVVVGMVCPPFQMICNNLLKLVQSFFAWSSQLPGTIVFGKPPVIFVLLWLVLLMAWLIFPPKKLLLSCLLLSYGVAYGWIHVPLKNEVTYFDIGQGDCTLIRTRFNRQIYLIDTGGKVSFSSEKWQIRNSRTNGETVVVNYLYSQGLSHIDRMYLTHQDTDHVGNFPSISRKMKIRQIIVPAGMEKLASFQERLKAALLAPQLVSAVTDKDNDSSVDSNLQILHPFTSGQGKNEDSLVLFYRWTKASFLFTGDLDRANELKVLAKYPALQADIIKTGHHGSKTASDPAFIAQIKPKLAIISAGRNNRYGHPNQETLLTLKRECIPFLLTATDGMIKITEQSGHKIKVTTFSSTNGY